MRSRSIALAGAAGLAIIAAQAPARASNTDFFIDQHKTYFESGSQPDSAAPAAEAAPAAAASEAPAATRRSARPTVAAVDPATAEPADADRDTRPVFGHGHALGGDEQVEQRPLASAIPREIVAYEGPQSPGTIVVSTQEKRLYYVLPDHQAIRYGVGVGRPGFEWSGGQTVTAKREWPDWTPPAAMIKRRPDIPHHMAGGLANPLGARAMYLGRTEYRIHGSNEPDTIGQAVSSGCIRMTNDDVADLYEHVKVGTKVIVER